MTTPRRRPKSNLRASHGPGSHLRVVATPGSPSSRDRPLYTYEPVEAGEVVKGRFLIEHRIGSGGMGVVYGGRHLELDQPIAIKFLLGEDAATDVRRFLKEARAVARLDSPHVARVLDAGVMETRRGRVVPYIVMEQLKGSDLQAFLALRGRLSVAEAVEYLIQACSGVAEAHGAGIVHRDLKPANLFLTARRDGAPLIKLLDFGISKSLGHVPRNVDASVTGEGEAVGSPAYMSPEQARGIRHIDARADIWSLGVILHELLTGTTAFAGETVSDVLVEVLRSPPRSILELAPEVPLALVNIVTRCLQKERDARYATVEELAEALTPFRTGATRFPGPRAGWPIGRPAVPDDALATTISRQASGHGWRPAALSLGVAVLVVSAFSAFAMIRSGTRADPVTTRVATEAPAAAAAVTTELPVPIATATSTEPAVTAPPPMEPTATTPPEVVTDSFPPTAPPRAADPDPGKPSARAATREPAARPLARAAPPPTIAPARPIPAVPAVPAVVKRQRTEW